MIINKKKKKKKHLLLEIASKCDIKAENSSTLCKFHSFIHFIFAFNKKYNNSIQKYIKDNIRTIFQLNHYEIKCGKGKEAYIEAGGL